MCRMAIKIVKEKSHGGRFLWNRRWDLGWIWANWHYRKKIKNYADYEHNLEAVFFMFSLAKKIKNQILIWNFTITLSLALTKWNSAFFSQEERHAVAKRRKKSHLEQNELAKMVYMCFNLSLTTIFTQNHNFFHTGRFWLLFFKFAQLYITVIHFSAWDR